MAEEISYSNCTRRESVYLNESELDTIECWLIGGTTGFGTRYIDFAEDRELMARMWKDFRGEE